VPDGGVSEALGGLGGNVAVKEIAGGVLKEAICDR